MSDKAIYLRAARSLLATVSDVPEGRDEELALAIESRHRRGNIRLTETPSGLVASPLEELETLALSIARSGDRIPEAEERARQAILALTGETVDVTFTCRWDDHNRRSWYVAEARHPKLSINGSPPSWGEAGPDPKTVGGDLVGRVAIRLRDAAK